MTTINVFLPVACLVLALGTQEGGIHRGGLPIRFSGESGIIEVPLDTSQLGWQLRTSATLVIERRESSKGDDGPDGEVVPSPILKQVPIDPADRVVKAVCFDLRLYGELTEEQKKLWLLATLSEKVVAARNRGLSAAEEEKLILAGRGDIKRFSDRIEEMRREFEVARKDFGVGRMFLKSPEMHRLAVEFQQGPFGETSFFAKTLAKIENDKALKKSHQGLGG